MAFLHALSLDELAEAAPVRVELDGVPVCLVRIGDSVRALHDMCSHQRWSLSDGEVSGGGVECSLHGSTFDLVTGAPSSLPATKPVPTFATRIVDRTVEVDVSVSTNGAPTPSH
ncbi:MAG: non-heme iron oxygenase ferredoxin subunit [Actinomycetota bacterium]|nr:non-heme iron oxygenase ferredoxin subunit [Actinomycetota bacterium]